MPQRHHLSDVRELAHEFRIEAGPHRNLGLLVVGLAFPVLPRLSGGSPNIVKRRSKPTGTTGRTRRAAAKNLDRLSAKPPAEIAMDDWLTRFISELVGLTHGPLSFRFILQPIMGLVYATIDGCADARAGRSPYFWTMFTHLEDRRRLLTEGWHRVARVITLGVLMEGLYQLYVLRSIHPLQMVVVVLGLAFLPYVVLRGPINRIAAWWMAKRQPSQPRAFSNETEEEKRRRNREGRGRYA